MLEHFDSVIETIEIDISNRLSTGDTVESKKGVKVGKTALYTLHIDFLSVMEKRIITINELWDDDFTSEDIAYKRWSEMFQSNIASLPQYFRYYYTIVKFIMSSEICDDKKFYTDILQAKMSSHEMALIFYNTFYNPEINKQRGAQLFISWLNDPYIGLLENMQVKSIFDTKDVKEKCNKINFKHF